MRKIKMPTKRMLDIYDYIVLYMTEHTYAPSIRDICAGTGLKSTSSVYSHLTALRDYGLLEFSKEQSRTIKLKGYKLVREDENINGTY